VIGDQVERRDVEQTVGRAQAALSSDTAQLKARIADWAVWDDTYAFVKRFDPRYVASNLTDEALSTPGLDFMVFLDSAGRIVYSKALDPLTGKSTKLPEGLRAYLAKDPLR